MSTPTTDASTEEWDRAVMEKRRQTRSTNSSKSSSDNSSTFPTNPNNTPTSEYREMISRHLAKTAGMEAAEYANAKIAYKEEQKNKDIDYIKSGKASPRQMADFKSIYHDEIREEVEGAKSAADEAADEARKRRSPTTPRSAATTPIPIPPPTKPTKYYLGGRTKRRSTKGRKTRKGKRAIKSKKAKKAHRSKKYKRTSRKR